MAFRLHPLGLVGFLLLAWFGQGAALAASYNVELLLLRWDQGASRENWSANNGWDTRTRLPEADWRPLPESAWALGSVASALDQTRGRVTPIFHTAWRQQAPNRSNPLEVPVRSEQTTADGRPRVEGSVVTTAGRFLHLELDLLVREPGSAAAGSDPGPRLYRIRAQRKMSRNQLHYIDHPKVGALIRIQR